MKYTLPRESIFKCIRIQYVLDVLCLLYVIKKYPEFGCVDTNLHINQIITKENNQTE